MMNDLNFYFSGESCTLTNIYDETDSIETSNLVQMLFDLPLKSITREILKNESTCDLFPKDVPQFSNLRNGTVGLCKALRDRYNQGYNYEEIGKLLLGPGKKDSAYTKYGENHSKLSEMLGFVQIVKVGNRKKVYLTNLGSYLCDLKKNVQATVIKKSIFRCKIVRNLISKSSINDISLENELSFLAETTRVRRTPNVKELLKLINENGELNYFLEGVIGNG